MNRTLGIAIVLFFCSGALGLGYELVWIRKAALVVGASQIALSTILTSFFLGLALGSYFVGRRLRSAKWSPLFIYGLFEVGIGVFALLFPTLFALLESVYSAVYPSVADAPFLLFALRFALLFGLCLPPTFLMGGTLPLLLDALVAQDRAIGSRTSLLYGINILGAVAGVLATSYYAIPMFGMDGSSMLGGVGNLVLGLVAITAFRGLRPVHVDEEFAPTRPVFSLLALGSGLIAIGYQISWARYFTLFQDMTVYFTAMLLAVFLLALAVGSMILAPLLAARFPPLRIAGYLQAGIPICALFGLEWWRVADYHTQQLAESLPDGRRVPVATGELNHDYEFYWHFVSERADATFFAPLFQISLVLFVPVVLMGVTLPAVIAAATRQSAQLRANAGRLVFWNTVGASLGGFLAGYVLIPWLGLHWTLFALACGSVALSLGAHLQAGTGRSAVPGLGVGAVALGGVLYFGFAAEDVTARTIDRFGYGRGFDPKDGGLRLIEVNEGPLNTSFVFESPTSLQIGSGNVSLAVMFKDFPSTQAIQGHVPPLFFPGARSPKDCLGICLGSGQSVGALLSYPVRRLDVVDISRSIVELSLRHFVDYNHGLAADPRVNFHFDDGRHYISRAPPASVDVITMEPPPPAEEGVYALYSREFYEQCARVMRDGGVLMQWLPLYMVTPIDAKSILRTQADVFSETFVIMVGRADFMVVSYKLKPGELRLDPAVLAERCKTFEKERLVKGWRWFPANQHDLASLEGVLSLIIMGPEDVSELKSDPEALLLRDDTQQLGYGGADRRMLRLYKGPEVARYAFAALAVTPFAELNRYFAPPLTEDRLEVLGRERAASLSFFGVPPPSLVRELRARDSAASLLDLARLLDQPLWKSQALDAIEAALRKQPGRGDVRTMEIVRGVARNQVEVYSDRIEAWLRRIRSVDGGRFALAPIVQAMEKELASFLVRREANQQRYLGR